MHSALRENGHLVRIEPIRHAADAVLEREFRDEGTGGDDVDFGTARVRVGRVEAAGAEEAEGHGDAGAD